MQRLNKIKRNFVFLFILSFSNSIFCDDQNWGGILPYAYKDGQAYMLVSVDSEKNEDFFWGDFSCKLEEVDNLYEKIPLHTYLETNGVLGDKNFFKNKISNFNDTVYAINIKNKIGQFNIDCFLYVVEVPFISAQIFINSLCVDSKNYFGVLDDRGFKGIGFAWIKIQDVIHIVNERKNLETDSSKPIKIKISENSVFSAKTAEFKEKFPDNAVVLNPYFSAEVLSDGVLEILNRIVGLAFSKSVLNKK
jgi:hypothetical protein